jgi:hypothetical protein
VHELDKALTAPKRAITTESVVSVYVSLMTRRLSLYPVKAQTIPALLTGEKKAPEVDAKKGILLWRQSMPRSLGAS